MPLYHFPKFTKRQLEVLRGMLRYRWIAALQARAVPDALRALSAAPARFPLDLVTDFVVATDEFSDLMDPVVYWQQALIASKADDIRTAMTPAMHERFLELVGEAYDGLAAGKSESSRQLVEEIQAEQAALEQVLLDAPMADPNTVLSAEAAGTRLLPSGSAPSTVN